MAELVTDQHTAEVQRRICKLEESVVNRIAAGEIIQRPANALKELLENAIDAQATTIEILVKEGGLKLLQITDNGSGVHRDDMAILCERFTTSKLRTFNDLNSMATYGFRGEALASITHISQVTITTKTEDSQCAYRASYADGHLIPVKPGSTADPKPVAGKKGTQITVENMFYNVPSRKRALNKPSEEYAKIIDVVNRYATHSEGIAFSCKKQGENTFSVSTTSKNSVTDNIRLIYGSSIANELLAFHVHDDSYNFTAKGLMTNANYHVKKMTLLLFVNNRAVESHSIKKALENLYAAFLPKGTHPFAYISLQLDPSKIDVNVHPTKREVNILNEDEILIIMTAAIVKRLSETDNARSYYSQTILPGAPLEAGISSEKIRRSINTTGPQNPSTFVRTDSRQQKIVSMLDPSYKGQKNLDLEEPDDEPPNDAERVTIRLASVKELRAEVRSSIHEDLTAIFTEHVFVGIVDLASRFCVIQHLTKLYLVDYGAVSAELFYQIGLSEFGNFGTITLQPSLILKDLLSAAFVQQQAKQPPDARVRDIEKDEHIAKGYDALHSRRAMLREYFSIHITDEGQLQSIPLLMKNYTPALSKLPNFLLRLGTNVAWEREKECFKTFLMELALFHVPEVYISPSCPAAISSNGRSFSGNPHELEAGPPAPEVAGPFDSKETELRSVIENVLFQAFKKRLIASKQLAAEKRVNQIGELGQLYKIFERC